MKRLVKWFVFFSFILVTFTTGIFVYLSSYDLNFLKPIIEQAAIDATGRKLTIQGSIYFHVGWPPGICITDITLDNASWSDKPQMLHVGKLEVDIELLPLLDKNIHVKQLTLNDFNLSIEINEQGRSNLEFEAPPETQLSNEQASHEIEAPQLGFNNLCLKNIQLSYEHANEPNPLSITINQIHARSKGLNSPIHMDIIGEFRNHQFDIQADVGSIHNLLNPKENWPLTLTAQGAGMSLSANGHIQDVLTVKGMNVEMLCKGEQFKQFQEMMGTSIPLDGPYRFQVGLTEKKNKQYKSSVDISLGNNQMLGMGEFFYDRKRPGLKLIFDANTIDLRPFISKVSSDDEDQDEGDDEEASSLPKNKRFFSDQSLLPSPLSNIDFVGLFRIKTLMMPKLAIHDLNTQIQLSPNIFEMKPFSANIGGGKIAAQVTIKTEPKVKIYTNLLTKGMNVGKMLKELDISDIFDGVLDFRVHLSTEGNSSLQWMSQLDGYVAINMEEGKLYNQYMNMLGGELSTNLIRLINPLKKNRYTKINCMAARFDIHDGLANTTIMMMDTDQMRLIGKGKLLLDKETIDIAIRPLPKSGLNTGRLGKYSLSLSQLAQPFKLGGTLKNPQLEIDYKKAAWTIGKVVGGVMLFGPVGIAAGLISGVAKNNNPCEIAKTVVRTGKYPEGFQHEDR